MDWVVRKGVLEMISFSLRSGLEGRNHIQMTREKMQVEKIDGTGP